MNFHLPFNGDSFIANNFLKLKQKFNIENVVETGTYEGDTTIFLAKNFKNVFSIECNPEAILKAILNIKNANVNAHLIFGKSEEVFNVLLPKINNNTILIFCFKDSYVQEYTPSIGKKSYCGNSYYYYVRNKSALKV